MEALDWMPSGSQASSMTGDPNKFYLGEKSGLRPQLSIVRSNSLSLASRGNCFCSLGLPQQITTDLVASSGRNVFFHGSGGRRHQDVSRIDPYLSLAFGGCWPSLAYKRVILISASIVTCLALCVSVSSLLSLLRTFVIGFRAHSNLGRTHLKTLTLSSD